MPLTPTGEAVLRRMKARYGAKRGRAIFYASINKGVPGSEKWHRIRDRKRRRGS